MADLVKDAASRRLLKDATDLRVGADASERLAQLLEEIATQIAAGAKDAALADGRTTVLARDLDEGFETFLHTGAPSLLSAPTLHQAIQQLDTPTFIELTQLLRADLQEDP